MPSRAGTLSALSVATRTECPTAGPCLRLGPRHEECGTGPWLPRALRETQILPGVGLRDVGQLAAAAELPGAVTATSPLTWCSPFCSPPGIWSWLSPATEHVVLGGEERQDARVSDRKRPGLREYDRHATVSTSLNVQFDQSTDVHSRAIATLIRKRNTSRKLPHAALQPALPHLQVTTDPPPGAAPSVCPTRKPLGQSPSPQVLSWVRSFGSVRRWRDRVSPCAPVLCSCYREPALDCRSIHGPMAAGRVPGPAAMNSRVRVFPWANLALASGHAVTAH